MHKEPAAYSDPTHWDITRQNPPPDLWPIILHHYIRPLTTLHHAHRLTLVPSLFSVYRPPVYEISRGRSGTSLHCFPAGTLGAADLTTADGSPILHHLDVIIDHTPFRRFAVYSGHNFIHVDYGEPGRRSGDRRSLWLAQSLKSKWIRQSWLAEPL